MESRRNHLALFTEQELAAGLALMASEPNAREVAAEVYAIPAGEQACFEWIDTALMLVSSISDELAERVRAHFGATPEERAEIERQQSEFRVWLRSSVRERRTLLTIEDVVFDTRTEDRS